MAGSSPTRVVEGFAPFVQRALDRRHALEALGPARMSGDEPRGSAGESGWAAAEHAGDRVNLGPLASGD